VWGVLDTGPVGAHATQAVLPARQLQLAGKDLSNDVLAVLPYTFCTLWKGLTDAGLNQSSARGRRVLLHGASGGLGTMALQVLSHWGASTTAICSAKNVSACLQAGATQAFDRSNHALEELPANFDAVLNFATWDDEALLACKLGPGALGMASTTHPLLGSIDELGWIRGLLHLRNERNRMLSIVKERSKSARYAWTIFGPDPQALTALNQFVQQGLVLLPVGITVAADHASAAFEHIRDRRSGRAAMALAI
jgi:NADPH:quinone reductase-like Zn-dependent oxidoreductase